MESELSKNMRRMETLDLRWVELKCEKKTELRWSRIELTCEMEWSSVLRWIKLPCGTEWSSIVRRIGQNWAKIEADWAHFYGGIELTFEPEMSWDIRRIELSCEIERSSVVRQNGAQMWCGLSSLVRQNWAKVEADGAHFWGEIELRYEDLTSETEWINVELRYERKWAQLNFASVPVISEERFWELISMEVKLWSCWIWVSSDSRLLHSKNFLKFYFHKEWIYMLECTFLRYSNKSVLRFL